MKIFSATAHTNIALIKYWGKSTYEGNLPATGSLSLTLDKFYTTTSVQMIDGPSDIFELNESPADAQTQQRVISFVDFFRNLTKNKERFIIRSYNHVPTKAGLASSASGFAALTLALARAFNLKSNHKELSQIARRGSGSAARSIFGNFVQMHGGPQITDREAFAEPLEAPSGLNVRMIVLECGRTQKSIGSREAMNLTSSTSIFYRAFLDNHPRLLNAAVLAAKNGNFEELGLLMEQSTLQMHATMLGCEQPFWYFNPSTIVALQEVQRLRQKGHSCYFTMDAGPHVKILCPANEADIIADSFRQIEGIVNITICSAGPGAYLHA